ncbi:MAG: hypothetical protein JXR81_00030 [Candidatus Goldbacteria bacterium]|nr:hypothetical protein [Candidatus Goldiibacteriota bacterium]
MKKNILLTIITVLAVVLIGCSKGVTGPAGAPGSDGSNVTTIVLENGVYPSSAYNSIEGSAMMHGTVGNDFTAIDTGSCANVSVGYTDVMNFGAMRGVIRGDVSYIIPDNVDVVSAKLVVNVIGISGSNINVSAYKLNAAWTKGSQCIATSTDGVTWATTNGTTPWASAGGDYDAASSGGATAITATDEYEIEIKPSVVEGWLADPSTNFGVILISSNETTEGYFSIVGADAKLKLTYILP